MAVLTDSQVKDEIRKLPGWQQKDKAIQRTFEFPDFKAAMRFVNQVAETAEQANHHPDIDIRYNKVVTSLISHDAGGVTQKDVRMAGKISEIAGI